MSETESGKPRRLSDEELAVDVATEIGLPPEEMWPEFDEPAEKAKAPAAKAEVAELDFVDGAPGVTVPLKWKFRLDGKLIDQIVVRPLTVEEMADVVTGAQAASALDSMAFYARMTGLPAPVLRALPGPDGEAVTAACYDFLPRFMRDGGSRPIPDDGGA